MPPVVLITFFGMLGVAARYGLGLWMVTTFPAALPWVTFGINILGAFAMGVIYVLGFEHSSISPELRMSLTIGLLGGFTTFSAYCIDAIRLWENGEFMQATFYYLGSPALGLLACYFGVILVRAVLA